METAPAERAAPPAPADFGALLRRHRRAVGLTQEALAERAGLSARGLSDLERGVRGARRAPQRETLRRLAGALGLAGPDLAAFVAAARARPAAPGAPSPAPRADEPAGGLVGRDRELAAVAALLRDGARLVTLTGPGGVGKTRLALAVAAAAPPLVDAPVVAELAPLADPALLLPTVARAAGVREPEGQPLTLALRASLAGRRVLLVLDNCEHLAPAAAELAADLLAASPDLTILATSRGPLRLQAERTYPVPPLAVPDATTSAALAASPAVRLFAERARAARPDFALTEENAATIAAICAELDGLPLAIELAAARVRLVPPAALLELLRDRLRLLSGGPVDTPARHRSLRDAVAWSHALLAPEEQALFRRLAVFAGGGDLELIASVATDGDPFAALDGLEALADQSLVGRGDDAEGWPRFAMIETIRAFALERLAEIEEEASVRDAHSAAYLDLAERAEPALVGPEQRSWLRRLDGEHANLRAALGWAIEQGRAEVAARLAGALGRFWLVRGHLDEGRRWLERALAGRGEVPAAVRAHALAAAAALAQGQGDYGRAAVAYDESLAICRALDDPEGMARALVGLGTIAAIRGEAAEAEALLDEGRALAERAGDDLGLAAALTGLGHLASDRENYPLAAAHYAESLAHQRSLGNAHGIAAALSNLGIVARLRGDPAEAAALHAESLALRRDLGDRQGVAAALNNLANVVHDRGDRAEATKLHAESLALDREVGNLAGVGASLHNLAYLALADGDARRAAALYQESLALYARVGDRQWTAECVLGLALVAAAAGGPAEGAARLLGAAEALGGRPLTEDDDIAEAAALLRARLGQAEYAAAAAGSALSLDEAVREAAAITVT